MLCGISPPFGRLSPTEGQVTHAVLSRSPLERSLAPPPQPLSGAARRRGKGAQDGAHWLTSTGGDSIKWAKRCKEVLMQGKYFQELRVGEVFQSPRRTVTETDVVLFTSLAGLHNPLFTDEVFAQEKGFGSRVAPGPLTISIALGLTDELLYGTTTAALGVNNAVFKAPVRPGDPVR